MNDQTAKADNGKPRLTLVPRQIIWDIAEVRGFGNAKYPEGGEDNWKKVEIQRYRDALFRHFMAYLDNPYGVDEESGIPHYMHMACNMAFICEMEHERRLKKQADDIAKDIQKVIDEFSRSTVPQYGGTPMPDVYWIDAGKIDAGKNGLSRPCESASDTNGSDSRSLAEKNEPCIEAKER